ncbi:hypothetical protein GF396_05455 [Candidatus Pacearchaeota archaeon]|nr:hypothetical protein [Candidatus Pacearchaeota archaeon]
MNRNLEKARKLFNELEKKEENLSKTFKAVIQERLVYTKKLLETRN